MQFPSVIIDILSETAIPKNERFFCLTHRQSYVKLADLLFCLAGNIFKVTTFELQFNRKDLAEMAGMSTERVIRTLTKFQDDRLINNTGKRFEIIKPEGFLKICQLG